MDNNEKARALTIFRLNPKLTIEAISNKFTNKKFNDAMNAHFLRVIGASEREIMDAMGVPIELLEDKQHG